MISRTVKFVFYLTLFAILTAAGGCTQGARVGELRNESETVELGDVDSVGVEIDFGAGELNVTGGASELMEADFTYNVDEIKPQVTYSGGDLTVRQGEARAGITSLFDLDEYRNEWDLSFNDDVPMDMTINLGAGRSDLVLGSLALDKVVVNAGAGEVMLELTGAPSVSNLDFLMGAGQVTLDLTGGWQNDLDASIDGGVGELTLRLPDDAGVRVQVDRGIGQINTNGLSQDGDVYVNDAYETAEVRIRIDISAGVGQINLISE